MWRKNGLELEKRLGDLDTQSKIHRDAYAQAMKAFASLPKNASAARKLDAFTNVHSAATEFFNSHERLVSVASLLRASHDDTWFTDHVETAENVLQTILNHFVTMRAKAPECGVPVPVPSSTAFAGLQRLVMTADEKRAKLLRDDWVRAGLPIHGFDTDEHHKHRFDSRWFIIGCVLLVVALAFAFWGFAVENLSPDRRRILVWTLPLASGFAVGAFSGSISVKMKNVIPGLVVSAAGGFAVWVLTFFFLFPSDQKDSSLRSPTSLNSVPREDVRRDSPSATTSVTDNHSAALRFQFRPKTVSVDRGMGEYTVKFVIPNGEPVSWTSPKFLAQDGAVDLFKLGSPIVVNPMQGEETFEVQIWVRTPIWNNGQEFKLASQRVVFGQIKSSYTLSSHFALFDSGLTMEAESELRRIP